MRRLARLACVLIVGAWCAPAVEELSSLVGSVVDPANLPTFSVITPSLCNDGHDCVNASVDAFAHKVLQPILDSAAYQSGNTAVMVMYDEDRPVPNLLIAPTAGRGANHTSGAGHAAMLRTWDEMLGLPLISQPAITGAISLRGPAHI